MPVKTPSEKAEKKVQTIGNGIFTADEISNWDSIKEKMVDLGYEERLLDCAYHSFVVPPGHPDYQPLTEIASDRYPNITPVTIKHRIGNLMSSIVFQLINGQDADKYQPATKTRKTKTRKPKPLEHYREQAADLAKRELSRSFREDNDLPPRGQISGDFRTEHDQFIEDHMEKATNLKLQELLQSKGLSEDDLKTEDASEE